MENVTFKIPPLARVCGLGEFPPVIEPALKELQPALPQNVVLLDDESLDVAYKTRAHITEDVFRRIHAAAAENRDFQKLVGAKRHVTIGISKLEPKREPHYYVLVAYNYEDNHAVEMTFSLDLEVKKVERADYQPAPTNEEIERAVSLARQDERIRAYVNDDMNGGGILTAPLNPENVQYGNRLLDVRIGYANERLPVCKALVNLATDTVISAGRISSTQKTTEVHHGC